MPHAMTNSEIAVRLQKHAADLAARGENLYRVRAFRQAAFTVLSLNRPINSFEKDELKQIRGIGESLAETIGQFAKTGEWHVKRQ